MAATKKGIPTATLELSGGCESRIVQLKTLYIASNYFRANLPLLKTLS